MFEVPFDRHVFGAGVWVDQLPDDVNHTSIVLLLTYGQTELLLTGDIGAEIEESIMEQVGDIDVLKVAHHGSVYSSSFQFLKTVRPEAAVIPVGEKNQYSHPHPIVLKRLSDQKVDIYRTDRDGDVLLVSDGDQFQILSSPLPF